MGKRAVERLMRILDVERSALMQGDPDTVVSLIDEKENLVEQFGDVGSVELKALSFKLAQNGRLLDAARAGVNDAVSTMKKLNAARTSLSSYDRSGKATEIRPTSTSTDRRF